MYAVCLSLLFMCFIRLYALFCLPHTSISFSILLMNYSSLAFGSFLLYLYFVPCLVFTCTTTNCLLTVFEGKNYNQFVITWSVSLFHILRYLLFLIYWCLPSYLTGYFENYCFYLIPFIKYIFCFCHCILWINRHWHRSLTLSSCVEYILYLRFVLWNDTRCHFILMTHDCVMKWHKITFSSSLPFSYFKFRSKQKIIRTQVAPLIKTDVSDLRNYFLIDWQPHHPLMIDAHVHYRYVYVGLPSYRR